MIQRIQTVYLLLAALATTLLIFVPLGSIDDPESSTSLGICVHHMSPVMIGAIISGVISLVSIFLYRNYNLQMNVIRINIVLCFLLIAGICYYLLLEPVTRISTPGIGIPLPVFALIFNFLAVKGVKHDHNLIRSYDRLR